MAVPSRAELFTPSPRKPFGFAIVAGTTVDYMNSSNNSTLIQFQSALNTAFTSGLQTTQDTSLSLGQGDGVFGGLSAGTRYYIRARGYNASGWGPWSYVSHFDVDPVPDAPSSPELEYIPANSVVFKATRPSAPSTSRIDGYQVQYADNASWNNHLAPYFDYSAFADFEAKLGNLTMGKTWYFRVRAKSSQGWGPWSSTVSHLIGSGPQVFYNGKWRNTAAFVNVDGAWKPAVIYVNYMGVWKLGVG